MQLLALTLMMEILLLSTITDIVNIKNPPEGMTSDEVRDMSDDDLLDMDYFLHEFDDFDDDDLGAEGFYIF